MSTGGAGQGRPISSPTQTGNKPGIVTKDQIHFHLTEDEVHQAQDCIRKSGQISIKFGEIIVTRLPVTLDNGRQID